MKNFSELGTLLTKEEAKKITGGRYCPVCESTPCICEGTGGPTCWLYCCDHGGNCSGGVHMGNESCSTHEWCQERGGMKGWVCYGGTYLAALCK